MKRSFLSSVLLAGTLALATGAAADVANETLAETLYQAAVQLIRDGNYEEACPKLAESHKADPAGGTVLLLAICYEKVGKTASAWIKFKEALAMARADRRSDREQRARDHLSALEPRLSRVTVVMPDDVRALPGFTVTVDGIAIPASSQSWTMPVDPGSHSIQATATGKQPWSTGLTLKSEDGQKISVEVPMLDDTPAEPTPPPPPVTEQPPPPAPPPPPVPEETALPEKAPGKTQRTIAMAVGGVGLATLGVGSFFGVQAVRKDNDARAQCPSISCSDADGVSLSDDAMDHAARANILFTTGGTLVAAGAVLYVTAPKRERQTSWHTVVAPLPGGAAIRASGRF